MAEKKVEVAKVLRNEELMEGVYSLWLQTEDIAAMANPGQFIGVYSNDTGNMLPRPISLCEIDANTGVLRIVFRVVGKGTLEFSKMNPGDTVKIMGPLGNGFPIKKGRRMVIGGGIGVPPLLELAKNLSGEVTAVMGYRDEQFLVEEFEKVSKMYIATEDGSKGTRGNVLDAIREERLEADVIYACGPKPMLKAIKEYAIDNNIECYISLEEKMGCGIGACLACVCKTKEVDAHSKVHNTRICKEGPVFLATEVEL